MGFMNVGDIKRYVWYVFIEERILINIPSRYILCNRICSFFIKIGFLKSKLHKIYVYTAVSTVFVNELNKRV